MKCACHIVAEDVAEATVEVEENHHHRDKVKVPSPATDVDTLSTRTKAALYQARCARHAESGSLPNGLP